MTLLRAGTYRFFHYDQLGAGEAFAAFVLGLRFDLRVVAVLGVVMLVLGSVPRLDPFRDETRRLRWWLGGLAVVHAALVVLYLADALHYRYLNQRLNASVLGYADDARIAAEMVWQTYPVVWLGLGALAATAALTWVAGRLQRWAGEVRVGAEGGKRERKLGWGVVVGLGLAVGVFGRLGQYPLRWSDAFDLRNDAAANLALNPVQSFLSSLSFRASSHDVARVRQHYAAVSDYLGVAASDAEKLVFARQLTGRAEGAGGGGNAARPRNVVLVICESFSGYKSSMWGNPLDTTPFFAELCRQGVFFDNCFTPHIGTARGVWATVTGLPDVEPRQTASRNPALVDQHTIINDFTAHEKFYFLGGSSSWANIRGLLANNIRGLQLYEEGSYNSPRIDVWGISDKNLFLEANDVLRKQTAPFFAVIQTADNHRPYTIPKEDLGAFQRVTLPAAELKRGGFESNDELNAFRYTDFAFRAFVEAARKEAYFEQTLFVFIGDHGIGGDAGTMFPPAWTEDQLTCYHVPLLFYAPGRLKPRRIHAVASMVDVLPTIAGAMGIAYRNNGFGRDLLRQQEIDGGRSNTAFVIDHHNRMVGVVRGAHFTALRQDTGAARRVWADFATAPSPQGAADERDDAAATTDRALAEGFYETARYLLRHNRKVSAPATPAD